MISVWLDHCSGLQLVADSVVWRAVQRRWWTTVWTLQGDVQDYLRRGHYIRKKCESRTPCIYVCIFAITCRCKLCKFLDQIYVFCFAHEHMLNMLECHFIFDDEEILYLWQFSEILGILSYHRFPPCKHFWNLLCLLLHFLMYWYDFYFIYA